MTIRVLLVDDDPLVRSGLKMMLAGAEQVEVVGEADDGRGVLAAVDLHRPDVVLMDIRMPQLDGIAATRLLRGQPDPPAVVVLTTFDADEYVLRALRAGAAGFLLKATPPDRLVTGIETVAAGEALLAPELTQRLIAEHVRGPAPVAGVPSVLAGLTDREREVFGLMARGLSNEEVRGALVISEATVKTHVNRILAKLGLTSRVQVVVLGYESGTVRPGEGALP
jgi:DNA-binding NarL/FixJ family response regulator